MEKLGLLQEGRVRDLVSTADGQLASKSYNAAIDTYRTALVELSGHAAAERTRIEGRLATGLLGRARYHQAAGRFGQAFASVAEALSIEPSNPAAAELRQQLIQARPELAAPTTVPAEKVAPAAEVPPADEVVLVAEIAPAVAQPAAAEACPAVDVVNTAEPESRPIEAPSFHQFDSDAPLLETPHHEDYETEPEPLSILNPVPPGPEPANPMLVVAIILAAVAVAWAITAASNHNWHHVNMDDPPVKVDTGSPPLAGPQAPAERVGTGDNTVYNVGGGVSVPMLRSKVEPEYTEDARRAKIQGTVVLGLQVDATGNPVKIQVLRGLDGGLNERAIEAVRKWRFQPGKKDGKPVTVAAQVEVNFRLL